MFFSARKSAASSVLRSREFVLHTRHQIADVRTAIEYFVQAVKDGLVLIRQNTEFHVEQSPRPVSRRRVATGCGDGTVPFLKHLLQFGVYAIQLFLEIVTSPMQALQQFRRDFARGCRA